MDNTKKILAEKYGLLLDLKQVAEVLHRSPEGMRFTLRGESSLAQKLRTGRQKIGRRVLFRVDVVASIVDYGVGDAA